VLKINAAGITAEECILIKEYCISVDMYILKFFDGTFCAILCIACLKKTYVEHSSIEQCCQNTNIMHDLQKIKIQIIPVFVVQNCLLSCDQGRHQK
jgi:hypothetical protein